MDNNINTINADKENIQNSNLLTDIIKVDKIVNPNDIVPLQKEKPSENQQTSSNTTQTQQQIKKDDTKKIDIENTKNNDILNALDTIINDDTKKLTPSIKNRVMMAIFTFGESEKIRNMNFAQKLWYKTKPFFLVLLKYITFGIYKIPEKKYDMRLVHELNERMRKIVNKS